MATTGSAGRAVPDVGDADGTASTQVSSNQLWSQSHEHRGPAQGEPPQLDADSIALTQALDMNGQGTTDQGYVAFRGETAVTPNASVRYKTGEGFLLRAENGVDCLVVTAAGALNTTSTNGIRGDYGGANAADVRHDNGLQRYLFGESDASDGMPLPSQCVMGALLLRPRLEDATAGVNLETDANLQTDAPGVTRTLRWPNATMLGALNGYNPKAATMAWSSWTPVIPTGSKVYEVQEGTWFRCGPLVIAQFRLEYNTGSLIGNLTITGLPFADAATFYGVTGPSAAQTAIARDQDALAYRYLRMSGSTILVYDTAAGFTPQNGGTNANLTGQVMYFTAA